MKKEIQRLLSSAVILLAIMAVIDISVGIACDRLLTLIPDFSRDIAKDNYRLNRMTTDIVIIGSSRACHHYVTDMLGDSINAYTHHRYSIYNAAIDGIFVNSNTCAVESLLKRYTPKLLIFEIAAGEFLNSESQFSDVRYSEPHYRLNSTVHRYVNEISWQERIKAISNMYRYNGKVLSILSSFFLKGDTTGYEPLARTPVLKIEKEKKNSGISQYSVTNFTRMLDYCQTNNIRLIMATSPHYLPKNRRDTTDTNEFIRRECGKRNIPYIELFHLEQFNDSPRLFYDDSHLNDEGARIYTNLFFENLKPYLDGLKPR